MTHTPRWHGCVFIGVSLDGFIARPDGNLDWLTEPATRDHRASETSTPALVWETFFPTVDTLVMGRNTFETVLGFDEWPFPNKNVIILSSTLDTDDERVAVASSLDEAQRLLTLQEARRVYIDGGRTIQSFLAAGLIDELTVSIAPVLIGSGIRLFDGLDQDIALTLRGTHATGDDGMVRITYAVAAP
ncbi:Dihydrofolate reductase [Arthrobacter sp. SO5]|uniref:dihydrofolate reductase family protein n=1 Tax=Arthrobacter sp. SO5 TaxID=1897055 RepID=UPI001E5577E6|nr:dihydrofolate reductase family protein [Arthrobacter sp. SO5]MCB5275832.1 Dihydrofolate reductase [Arthrobacter sp. SO5]